MNEIKLLAKTAKRKKESLSKDKTKCCNLVLNRDHFNHNHGAFNHSTTLPR